MLNLQCPNCGAELACDHLSFVNVGDTYVYIGNEYVCEYCASKFTKNQQFQLKVNHQVNINTGGAAYIRGNLNLDGADFVGRDKVIIVRHL